MRLIEVVRSLLLPSEAWSRRPPPPQHNTTTTQHHHIYEVPSHAAGVEANHRGVAYYDARTHTAIQ